jgi:predicted transcriptional regulator
MTDDDIKRLRELAESVIRAAEQRQEAADDPAIDWTEYDRIAQDAVDQQEALVERVDARTLLALIEQIGGGR